MKRYTIAQLQQMRESEDHVEFKKGEHGNVSYNGGEKVKPKDRRKCILGYVTALCNEGGGRMAIGMDKIFLNTLSEGKPEPDYSESDDFNVTAILSANVKDKAFAMFVQDIQQSLPEDKKLTVFDVMTLCEVRDGKRPLTNKQIAQKLEQTGFLEKRGKTNAVHYILPRRYYELAGDTASYSLATDWDIDQVWAVIKPFLHKYKQAKRADFNTLIGNHLSEKQVRNFLEQLKEKGKLKTEGQTNQMYYMLGEKADQE